MIAPGQYDIDDLFTGASWELRVTLKDSTGTPINLNGYQVAASVWNPPKTVKYCDIQVAVLNPSGGELELSLSEATTKALDVSEGKAGYWDLLVTQPDGESYYWLRGAVTFRKGGTRRP